MSGSLRIAAVQMVSGTSVSENIEAAHALIERAAGEGAQLVVLPEFFCMMGRRDTDKLDIREPAGNGPIQRFLSDAAERFGVWIIGGTVPLLAPEPRRIWNSCLVFDPAGRQHARYDKIHLFGFTKGDERFDESATIAAGRTPVTCDIRPAAPAGADRFRVGLTICYDLRFPELYRALGRCDLIVVPSAFTYTTGQAHWETLLRARAIENQCYVLAPAQGGRHANGRRTWGHSMLIDPWGEVLGVLAEGEGVVAGTIDRVRLRDVRASLPALSHRTM